MDIPAAPPPSPVPRDLVAALAAPPGNPPGSGDGGGRGRGPNGKFAPGNRANPSGRPKDIHGFREMCRSKSELAVTKLVSVMLTSRNHLATVRAAEIILSYAWGKPNQPITGEDGAPLIPTKLAAMDALRAVVTAPALVLAAAGSPPPEAGPPPAEVGDAEPPTDPEPR